LKEGIVSLSRGIHAATAAILAACIWQGTAAAAGKPPSQTTQFTTTVDYVSEFYPLWLSYNQAAKTNRLAGPDRVTPAYREVVAINDDTLYASAFLDLSAEPVVLTIPKTGVTYSILVLDAYGDIKSVGLAAGQPGVYGLTGPNFTGTLPAGVTQVPMPLDHLLLIFRSDKYTSDGVNEVKQSRRFRAGLQLQTLSDWQQDPTGGHPTILPANVFLTSFKAIADALIAKDPITYLQQLQLAVAGPASPPLTAKQQKLSDKFNSLFAKGGDMTDFALGAKAAHALILADYLTHTDANHWVHFTNIGTWRAGQDLDRSAISEFLQYGNNSEAAAYYHAFEDGTGAALDGTDPAGYVINIPKDEIPQAKRFWSFTAYTPETVELIRNKSHKYEIASYTPGLTYNADGSLTLYIAQQQPAGVPEANWLPVRKGPFNIMLRVYGPEGSVAKNKYVPPPIMKAQ
jgi:hypothetical protein